MAIATSLKSLTHTKNNHVRTGVKLKFFTRVSHMIKGIIKGKVEILDWCQNVVLVNPLMPGGNKKFILKQTCS